MPYPEAMLKALLLVVMGTTLAPLVSSVPPVLSHYRDVTLGDSVDDVVDRLHLVASDVKVLHQRPSLVQELTWRPHRFVSGTTMTPDALAEMVLTFHIDRLVRIVATYDRERTQGLTDADLHESLSDVYGVPLLRSTPTQRPDRSLPHRETVDRWEDATTVLLLWREDYPGRVGLTITSINEDRALQEAITHGGRLDAQDAPKRALDEQAAKASANKARDEKIRLENKARFKP